MAEAGESGISPSFGLILRALDRVEGALVALTERFDTLDERFPTRREVRGLLQTEASERAAIAKTLGEVAEKLEQVEERRRADWKFVVTSVLTLGGLVLMALGTAVTLLIFILSHK